jgi:two-component SAPR family response regulator
MIDFSLPVVLVDDDAFSVKLIELQLSTLGFKTIRSFQDSEWALEFLLYEGDRTPLVICDLQMPRKDGVTIIKKLSEQRYRGGLILISGEDSSVLGLAKELAASLGLRILGALAKPVTIQKLWQCIEASEDTETMSG